MRALLTAAVLSLAAVATGCSGGSASPAATSSDSSTSSEASKAAGVAWSPCDTLTAASVSSLVGEKVGENDGTSDQPRCTFTPAEDGGAAYDVSYLWFDGGLDAALDSMGAISSQLERVRLPGADAARVAVKARKSGVLVTGFVQTKGLVQSVNAVQLAPYDEQQVVGATKRLLAELAAQAPPPSQK